MDSPLRLSLCDQETKCLGQQTPRSEQLYVALPGHPLYGRRVSVLGRRRTDTTTHCRVEDPQHPTFCYQILARWLCVEPPPPAISPDVRQRAIALPLITLDRLVQLLLGQQLPQADEHHEGTTGHSRGADLGPHSSDAESEAQ